ncbi:hypothetical protein ACFX15_019220 [Malus domestica]
MDFFAVMPGILNFKKAKHDVGTLMKLSEFSLGGALPCGAVQETAAGLRCVMPFGHNFPLAMTSSCGARNCLSSCCGFA